MKSKIISLHKLCYYCRVKPSACGKRVFRRHCICHISKASTYIFNYLLEASTISPLFEGLTMIRALVGLTIESKGIGELLFQTFTTPVTATENRPR